MPDRDQSKELAAALGITLHAFDVRFIEQIQRNMEGVDVKARMGMWQAISACPPVQRYVEHMQRLEALEAEARTRAWALGLDFDKECDAAKFAGERVSDRVGRAWEAANELSRRVFDRQPASWWMDIGRDLFNRGIRTIEVDMAHGSTRARRRALAAFLPGPVRDFYQRKGQPDIVLEEHVPRPGQPGVFDVKTGSRFPGRPMAGKTTLMDAWDELYAQRLVVLRPRGVSNISLRFLEEYHD